MKYPFNSAYWDKGESVYNGHFGGPGTLTLIAKRLAVVLSLPVFTTKLGLVFNSPFEEKPRPILPLYKSPPQKNCPRGVSMVSHSNHLRP